eukprot:s603_g7.t1
MRSVVLWTLATLAAADVCADQEEGLALLQLRENMSETEVEEEEVGCAKVPEHSCTSIYGQPFQATTSQTRKSTGDKLSPADCRLCKLGAKKPATLYAVERRDGLGERAANLINMMALAAKVGMNFGGLLEQAKKEVHGVYMPVSMTELLGTSYRRILQKAHAPHFDHCYFVDEQQILDAAEHGAPWHHGQDVLFVGCITGMVHNGDLLTPSFLDQLRKSTPLLKRATPHFKTKKLRVAMHLRRGDLHIGTNRGMPDEMYHRIMNTVRSIAGDDVEIHVFSSTEKNYKPASFKSYRNRGAEVHLDGNEVDDWAHMMQADVLLLSPSSFAWVPGVFNPNCVVGFNRYYPMGHWAVHRDGDFSQSALAKLEKCIEERKAAKAKHGR